MRCARILFGWVAVLAVILGVGCSHRTSSTQAGSNKLSTTAPIASGRTTSTPRATGTTPATGTRPGTTTLTPAPGGPSTPGATAPSRFLYTANYGDNSITELAIDATTGAPTVFGTVAVGDAPLRLVAHPSGSFLYAIERSEITPLAVDSRTGALTPASGPLVIAGDYPLAACPTPKGDFLVAGYYGGSLGGSVRSFAIGASGDLTAVDRFSLGATAMAVDVVVDATGHFAYVADQISMTITALAIDPLRGTLTPLGGPIPCPDVAALALDAKGAFLVAMTSASPGSIQSFALAANGTIGAAGAPLATGPHSPMAITVAPDGTFYVVTANSSLIAASLDAQGRLTEKSVTSVPAVGFPCALALDASGSFVYTANFAHDDVSVLAIGATGTITAGTNVAIAPRTAGNTTQPYWVATIR